MIRYPMLSWRICLDCGEASWFELQEEGFEVCVHCGGKESEDWTEQYVKREKE